MSNKAFATSTLESSCDLFVSVLCSQAVTKGSSTTNAREEVEYFILKQTSVNSAPL